MKTRQDIARFISEQQHLLRVLHLVQTLSLPDAWVGAGLIRNAVWDQIHFGAPDSHLGNDVDVVYFDTENIAQERDSAIENRLNATAPDVPWEVRNQARMHSRNDDPPYHSTEDALRYWPDTATAIAARIVGDGIEVVAPYGVDDLVGLIVRPTPPFEAKQDEYRERLASKDWGQRWPRLKFS